jgi:predicted nucleotidyltransferase
VEIDYTSNELAAALGGIVKGNGNYLERVLGAYPLLTSPLLAELAPIVQRSVNKRYHRHYLGFATQQRQLFEKSGAPTAKKVLYVLRTALTGTHLLRSGQLRVDLTENLDEYGYQDARELIERKKAGEQTVLDGATARHWLARVQRAFELLDQAHSASELPEDAPNVEELDAWLVDVRLRS